MVSSSEPQKPPESWCRYDLAFMVSPCWSMAQDVKDKLASRGLRRHVPEDTRGRLSWDVCHALARKMVSSSGPQRPPESWSRYGLASVVHPSVAQDGAVAWRGPPCAAATDG
ncbi:uncharacterized protein LOC105722702 isoform X7 [Aotus nancymaae]|uniref:uncharacterized protein LOC105722702 isoform X7 n=1 Tax=Aotus nancymaae TaxID=37293 RepID=UPI0030FED450